MLLKYFNNLFIGSVLWISVRRAFQMALVLEVELIILVCSFQQTSIKGTLLFAPPSEAPAYRKPTKYTQK